jgi:hypothetical protein
MTAPAPARTLADADVKRSPAMREVQELCAAFKVNSRPKLLTAAAAAGVISVVSVAEPAHQGDL